MTIAHHVDPEAFLAEFVRDHPGVRAGHLLGQPAAFAGRGAFAVVRADRLAVRMPSTMHRPGRALDARPVSSVETGRRSVVGRSGPAAPRAAAARWVSCRVPATAARLELVVWLEIAASHAARNQSGGGSRSGPWV